MLWSLVVDGFCFAILIATWRYLYLFLTEPLEFDEIHHPKSGKRTWSSAFLMYGGWIGAGYLIFVGLDLVMGRLSVSLRGVNEMDELPMKVILIVIGLVVSARSLFYLARQGHALANLERRTREEQVRAWERGHLA